jgi:hypothetical protein
MNHRGSESRWSSTVSPTAVVAEALSRQRAFLVSAERGPDRDQFVLGCLRAAAGKRILVLASDDDAAEPIRRILQTSELLRQQQADQDRIALARAAAERTIADADRELTALRATAAVRPGFFARLFGTAGPTKVIESRIAEWMARRSTAEAEIRSLDGRMPHGTIDNGRFVNEESKRKSHDATHLPDVTTATPLPESIAEGSLASMTANPSLSADDASLIRIATPADFAPVLPVPELVMTVAAERIPEPALSAVDAMGTAHVIVGDPSPSLANLPFATQSDAFAERWFAVPKPAWGREGERIVCRLKPCSGTRRDPYRCEPLLDRPEIELRFDADTALAEVVFPADFTAAMARAWLATELGEARPVAYGSAEWTIEKLGGETIRAVWPHASTPAGEWIESIPGVRECVSGTAADAPTAELRFDPAAGWTRESAEAWVNEMLALGMPPVATLEPAGVPEATIEFATAG